MSTRARLTAVFLGVATLSVGVSAREYHVGPSGNDQNAGTVSAMLKTISAASQRALPGDVIIVHRGIYRESIAPPRGGTSDAQRIVYQAAPGEQVVIKGSEIIKGWKKVDHDTWTVTLSNEIFGNFNPYADEIHGDWFHPKGRTHHTGAVYLNGHWLTEAATHQSVLAPANQTPLWWARVEGDTTTIWAQFPKVDPNRECVEIHVRRTVFYPRRPGINYITVRGFVLEQAATPWAPPTAEQVGLIGTHWSRGWIIEDNTVRYSSCVGIALGKYGDRWDNTSQNSARGYVETIRRALQNGWSGETIGHHVVRNNRISHCEQAGIVGSLGAIFSTIVDNDIHHIHVRKLFGGAEMAAIKLHAAIDTVIRGNHIHHSFRGIWLDWMAQGTRVTRNVLHDNDWAEDLFVEVNHGPFLIDHNIFLSSVSLRDWSQGGAYVHNLFAGRIVVRPDKRRLTPFHPLHSTQIAGLAKVEGGDNRFFNNLLAGPADLRGYDAMKFPVRMEGNVYVGGAVPSSGEAEPLVYSDLQWRPRVTDTNNECHLVLSPLPADSRKGRRVVTTSRLGTTQIAKLPFVHPDGRPYRLNRDFFGRVRSNTRVTAGPFQIDDTGPLELTVWPADANHGHQDGRLP